MTFKTTFLTGVAGLVLSAALVGVPSAFADTNRGDGRDFGRMLPRVAAEGAALNQNAARTQAVHNWREKVANRYGYTFSYWFTAKGKDVSCRKIADDDSSWDSYKSRGKAFAPQRRYEAVTRCTVSAIPARAWGMGWNKY
jgi:hypothetical protein